MSFYGIFNVFLLLVNFILAISQRNWHSVFGWFVAILFSVTYYIRVGV